MTDAGKDRGTQEDECSHRQLGRQVSWNACRHAEAVVGTLTGRQERPTGRLGQRQAEAGMHTEAWTQR
jgi:hypothetical protein